MRAQASGIVRSVCAWPTAWGVEAPRVISGLGSCAAKARPGSSTAIGNTRGTRRRMGAPGDFEWRQARMRGLNPRSRRSVRKLCDSRAVAALAPRFMPRRNKILASPSSLNVTLGGFMLEQYGLILALVCAFIAIL